MRYSIVILILLLTSCSVKKDIEKRAFQEDRTELARLKMVWPDFNLRIPFRPSTMDTLKIHDTILVEDKQSRIELRIWRDKYGQLQAECEGKGGTVESETISDVKTKEETTDKEVNRSGGFWWGVAAGIGAVILLRMFWGAFLRYANKF